MTPKLRRRVVALATTLACLALMANPASATTHTATITGGNLVLTAVPSGAALTFPWAGTAGTGCGHTLALDEDATAGTADITGYTSATRFNSFGTGAPYVTVVARTASTPGAVSGGLVSSSALSLQIDIFSAANANPATDCATGTQRCRLRTTLVFAGTLTGWSVSSTASLGYPTAGASSGFPAPCSSPWSAWIGSAVTGGPLAFHVTS